MTEIRIIVESGFTRHDIDAAHMIPALHGNSMITLLGEG